MAESPTLTVIRVWAAVAWADGVIAPAEADGFRRLIDASSLGPEDKALAGMLPYAQRFDLPQPEAPAPTEAKSSPGPGLDPEKPPRLR